MNKLSVLGERVRDRGIRSAVLLSVAAIQVWALTGSRAQGTLAFRFEGPPIPPRGSTRTIQQYFESGMWFRPLGPVGPGNGFGGVGGGVDALPENGTAYLDAAFTESLMFSFTNGSVFGMSALDLAEYSTVVSNAVTVHIVGYRHDGSVVTVDLTTDGIIDGTGPIADFQTFTFDNRFTDLDRVEIPTYGWSLDNLVVSVPEPGGGALLVLGGLALWAGRVRNAGVSITASRRTSQGQISVA